MKENIRETRFSNGLVILTDRMPGVRSATLGFFFRIGSRNEPAELNGISHFIEHAVFKGTAKRSSLDIAIEQDRLGGGLDAFTTHEETGFAIKVIDDQIPAAFDLIADMLANPSFEDADLKSEQRVIIEEMKMTEDSPEDLLGEIFSKAFFPEHPLGMNIAGRPKTIKRFNAAVTQKYHRDVFNPANLVITAAGNVDHKQIVKLAKKYFSGVMQVSGPQESRQDGGVPPVVAPIIIKQNKTLEQAHMIIATPFPGAADERRYAADLLANIIGGGTSSRLWQKIREERGLAYSVGASAVMYKDCGVFMIFAGTSPKQTQEIVAISISELSDVAKNGVGERELELAKDQSAASILLSLEDSAARAWTLAQCEMIYGRQIPVEETLARIAAVSTEDVHAIAREFFKTEKVAFAAVGNLKELKIKRRTLEITV